MNLGTTLLVGLVAIMLAHVTKVEHIADLLESLGGLFKWLMLWSLRCGGAIREAHDFYKRRKAYEAENDNLGVKQ